MIKSLQIFLFFASTSSFQHFQDYTHLCQNSQSGIISMPGDCSSFIMCPTGTRVTCPNGLLFNARLSVCDWPNRTECRVSKKPVSRKKKPKLITRKQLRRKPLILNFEARNVDRDRNMKHKNRAKLINTKNRRIAHLKQKNIPLKRPVNRNGILKVSKLNPTKFIVKFCADKKSGRVYKHPVNCQKFIKCGFGRKTSVASCLQTHSYDKLRGKCVWGVHNCKSKVLTRISKNKSDDFLQPIEIDRTSHHKKRKPYQQSSRVINKSSFANKHDSSTRAHKIVRASKFATVEFQKTAADLHKNKLIDNMQTMGSRNGALPNSFERTSRNVIYIDYKINWSDVTTDIKSAVDAGYNIIILSFYLQRSGLVDAALSFEKLPSHKQESIINYAHSHGAKIMISAGGATEHVDHMLLDTIPLEIAFSEGENYARGAAEKVNELNLDGIDFDIELLPQNNQPFLNGRMAQFVRGTVHGARKYLKKVDAIVTHAPQAPYLGPWAGSTMGYTGMIRDDPYVKENLDFLNIQFYNQGAGLYDSYEGLMKSQTGWTVGTSVTEMIINGVPPEKIVVGKPIGSRGYASNGYVSPRTLGLYLEKFKRENQNINIGGVMTWMYPGSNDPLLQEWSRGLGFLDNVDFDLLKY